MLLLLFAPLNFCLICEMFKERIRRRKYFSRNPSNGRSQPWCQSRSSGAICEPCGFLRNYGDTGVRSVQNSYSKVNQSLAFAKCLPALGLGRSSPMKLSVIMTRSEVGLALAARKLGIRHPDH